MERTIRALFRNKRFMLDKMPCIYSLKEGKIYMGYHTILEIWQILCGYSSTVAL